VARAFGELARHREYSSSLTTCVLFPDNHDAMYVTQLATSTGGDVPPGVTPEDYAATALKVFYKVAEPGH